MPLLGPEVSYVTMLDFGTEEALKREASSPPKYNPLRPSSAGKCTRELAYSLNEFVGNARYEKPALTADKKRVFELGHSVEFHVLRQFSQYASEFFEIRYKQQVLSFFKIEEPSDERLSRWIEGSLDMCFLSKDHKGIGDVKSKKEKYSSYHESDWDEMTERLRGMATVAPIGDDGKGFWVEDLEAFLKELNDPFFEQNFWQLNFYACNPFITERGIDHGFIIQYAKNTSRMREVRFRPSQKLYARTKEKFELATKAVAEGNPERAGRDYLLGSVKCAFCDFRNTCWAPTGPEDDPWKLYWRGQPRKDWPTDVGRLDGAVRQTLQRLYSDYAAAQTAEERQEGAEVALTKALIDAGLRKVKFEDGKTYEVKTLKSGVVLRRSKA